MNTPIRILLCDDSLVMRRMIKTALEADGSLRVVSEAKHGKEALDKLFDARPDLVVMDVEMPVMDGIDAVREIRKRTAKLPVIMFSSLTSRGAEATLDAMEVGASDVATKPSNIGHIGQAISHVQRELVPKIYKCVGMAPTNSKAAPRRTPQAKPSHKVASKGIEVVGVGVSTGGPEALEKLMSGLPHDFPIPILVVQHMPPIFTKRLAERLSSKTGHHVREAENGEEVTAGQILIAPGDHHLQATRDRSVVRTKLTQGPPENSCRPAVDPLFRSLATTYGSGCLGVVLTGMGKDGTDGARALRRSGAKILVQDKQSSVVWGMAGNIVECGLSDQVLPLDRMAQELIRSIQR